jgi:hypothetical protein
MPRLRAIGFALILSGAAFMSQAAAPELKVLTVGNAAISIAWDPAWQVSDPAPDAPPNSAQFHAANPHDMLAMITAEARPTADADVEGYMRHVIDATVKEFQPQSVEKELVPKPFTNGDVHGYRVCATDRAPKPEEYKYVCQGIATNGELAVVFTILYNEAGKAQGEKASAALEALQVPKST